MNASLAAVKVHLLGRDETGSVNEPGDIYDENPEWEFERDFKRFLEPWTQKDIEFECEDCGVESKEVYRQTFSHPYPQEEAVQRNSLQSFCNSFSRSKLRAPSTLFQLRV